MRFFFPEEFGILKFSIWMGIFSWFFEEKWIYYIFRYWLQYKVGDRVLLSNFLTTTEKKRSLLHTSIYLFAHCHTSHNIVRMIFFYFSDNFLLILSKFFYQNACTCICGPSLSALQSEIGNSIENLNIN